MSSRGISIGFTPNSAPIFSRQLLAIADFKFGKLDAVSASTNTAPSSFINPHVSFPWVVKLPKRIFIFSSKKNQKPFFNK